MTNFRLESGYLVAVADLFWKKDRWERKRRERQRDRDRKREECGWNSETEYLLHTCF